MTPYRLLGYATLVMLVLPILVVFALWDVLCRGGD